LLHSVPRQELGMEALGESEFGLFEWRRAFSIVKCKGQERRVVGGGCVYIGLSKESLDSIIFTLSNMSLLIVRYSYTQET
jgi:hypothetical protein